MTVEVKKGTPECREKCHLGGCADEIALACTCDDRMLEDKWRIMIDARGREEGPDKMSAKKIPQKIENMEQTIQSSLIQTISERGEFGVFKRFDI